MAFMSISAWATDINLAKVSIGDIVFGSTEAPGMLVTYEVELHENTHFSWDHKYYTDADCQNEAKDAENNVLDVSELPMATYYTKIVGIPGGGFSGEKIVSFKVTAKPLSDNSFVVATEGGPFTYDGTAKAFTTVKLYEYEAKVGLTTFVNGTKYFEKANGAFVETVDATPADNKIYYIKSELTAGENKDYTFLYSNNINAGANAKITFTGHGNYMGTKDFTFTINAKPAPAATSVTYTALPTSQNPVYSAAPVTTLPRFVVKDGNNTLTEGTDYTIRWYLQGGNTTDYVVEDPAATTPVYTSPVAVGTYCAVIFGKGNYESTPIAPETNTWTVTVAPKPVQVYVQSMEKVYDGTAIQFNNNSIKDANIVISGLCAKDNKDGIKAGITAVFVNAEGEKVNAGEYPMEPSIAVDAAINTNYKPEILETGIYTIKQREVTVKAKKQTLTYSGQALTINDAISEGNNGTVEIEQAKYDDEGKLLSTSTTGILKLNAGTGNDTGNDPAWDDITTGNNQLFALSQKSGVTILNKGTYTGAIEIVNPKAAAKGEPTAATIATRLANANYKVVGVAGDVEVTGQDLTLIAGSFNKEYGYTIDFEKDFNVVNTGNIKEWDPAPTYAVKDATGKSYTATDGILPIGIYTIEITNAQDIVPSNYQYNANKVYTGELKITQKNPKFKVNTVNLNAGDGLAELQKYVTVEYEAVGDDKIAYEVAFNNTLTLDNGKLKNSYTAEQLKNAVMITFINPETAAAQGKDPKNNEKYDLDYNTPVYGAINLGAAKSLKLDDADAQLLSKIKDAAAACAANAETKYTISFSSRELKQGQWTTFWLPFNTTVGEVSAALGYAIVDMLVESEASDDMNFRIHMGEIPAYTPFLVKVAENRNLAGVVDDPKTDAVETQAPITFDKAIIVDPTTVETNMTKSNKSYEFKTNLEKQVIGQNFWTTGSKMENDGFAFNQYSATATLKALRAYIVSKDGTATAPRIFIEEADGSTTAINAVKNENSASAEGWYTIGGMKLQGAPTQKGIYIKNGKKIVVK